VARAASPPVAAAVARSPPEPVCSRSHVHLSPFAAHSALIAAPATPPQARAAAPLRRLSTRVGEAAPKMPAQAKHVPRDGRRVQRHTTRRRGVSQRNSGAPPSGVTRSPKHTAAVLSRACPSGRRQRQHAAGASHGAGRSAVLAGLVPPPRQVFRQRSRFVNALYRASATPCRCACLPDHVLPITPACRDFTAPRPRCAPFCRTPSIFFRPVLIALPCSFHPSRGSACVATICEALQPSPPRATAAKFLQQRVFPCRPVPPHRWLIRPSIHCPTQEA